MICTHQRAILSTVAGTAAASPVHRHRQKIRLTAHYLFGFASTFSNRSDRSVWIDALGDLAQRFRRDQRGRVVAVLALAITPVLVIAALGLDLGRGYILKAELSDAIDAVGLTNWDPLDVDLHPGDIVRLFEANFPSGNMGAVLTGDGPSLIVNEHDNTITIEAEATMPTPLMSLAGVDEVTAVARSVIKR